MNIIYRKSDGAVMGQQWPPQGLNTEYRNIANGLDGTGDVADYAHIEAEETPPESRPIRVVAGVVEYESTEDVRKTERQARIAELLAIPRSGWTAAQQRELLQVVAQELTR